MVKLKNIPTFFWYNGRERSLEIALLGVKASLMAIVI